MRGEDAGAGCGKARAARVAAEEAEEDGDVSQAESCGRGGVRSVAKRDKEAIEGKGAVKDRA